MTRGHRVCKQLRGLPSLREANAPPAPQAVQGAPDRSGRSPYCVPLGARQTHDAGATVTVTNLSQASLGRPSPRALKPRLRYKLEHGVVGEVYYYLYTRGVGARPGRVVCLWLV